MLVIYMTFITMPADTYVIADTALTPSTDYAILDASDCVWMVPGTCDPSEG